ncbi:MAG: acyltransferase family protein [Desulfitobacterium sp.]
MGIQSAQIKADSNSAQDKKMFSLQVLRGIAAVCIVIYHLKGYTTIVWGKGETAFSFIPTVTGSGVLLFFCISGFLMAYLLMNNNKDFLKKRFLRIYPPYFLAVTLVILTKILLFNTYSINNLGRALTLLPFGGGSYVLNLEWTLIYEVFFYLVCSIFAVKKLNKFYPYFLAFWAVVVTLGIYYFRIPTVALSNIKIIFFAGYNYFFIAGGLAYFLHCKIKKINLQKNIRILLIIVFIGAFVICYENIFEFPASVMKYSFPVYSILIAGILLLAIDIPVKGNSFFVRLGDYSYGMYLIHAQVFWTIMTLYKNIGYSMSVGVGGIALICALVVGWNFGKFEVWLHGKLRKMKWNLSTMQKRKIIIVGLLCIVWIGIFILNSTGITGMRANTLSSVQQAETSKTVPGKKEPVVKVIENAEFDGSKVIKRKEISGWVDFISANIIEKKATLELKGWTVDTEKLTVPKQVVAVSDGEILDARLSWYQRQGVADLFKTNAVQNCGWSLNIKGEALKEGTNKIVIYALLDNGNWISLKVKEPIEVNVRN